MGKNFKPVLSFLIILMFSLPNFTFAATLEAWVAPSNINLTIKAGESGTFDLLTTTGTPPIKKLDVVFVIDRTGSMGGVIDQVKTTAVNIMNNVKSKVPDVRIWCYGISRLSWNL